MTPPDRLARLRELARHSPGCNSNFLNVDMSQDRCSCGLAAALAQAEAQVARLTATLLKYGRHDPVCERLGPHWEFPRRVYTENPCTCGFDAVLSPEEKK